MSRAGDMTEEAVLVPVELGTVRRVGAAPEVSAAPGRQEDAAEAEERRTHRASDPPRRREPETTPLDELPPEAVDTWNRVQPRRYSPDLSGCEPALYREPRQRSARATLPIVMGLGAAERLYFQPPPPSFVPGFSEGPARVRKRVARELSEDAAARRNAEADLRALPRATQAQALGLSERQLRRRIEQANRKKRTTTKGKR